VTKDGVIVHIELKGYENETVTTSWNHEKTVMDCLLEKYLNPQPLKNDARIIIINV
jgi:hypothetical protein